MKVQEGPAKPELIEQGWRTFLVKVINQAGDHAGAGGRESECGHARGQRGVESLTALARHPDVRQAALAPAALGPGSGVPHPAALLARCREAGGATRIQRRAGNAGYRVPQRGGHPLHRAARHEVTLRVKDDDGPTMASFVIRDGRSASIRRRPSGWRRILLSAADLSRRRRNVRCRPAITPSSTRAARSIAKTRSEFT